jgi:adenylate cyclase class 2
MTEIEVKLRVRDRAETVSRLAGLGWQVCAERELERNFVYDLPDRALEKSDRLLRIREQGGRCRLTFKGPAVDGRRHKVREEDEIEIPDGDGLRRILGDLGYQVVWRYEKFRTAYRRTGSGKLLLDETPIGDFLELEGEPEWIDQTAKELGYEVSDYVTSTYGALFRQYRNENPAAGADMVF